ncbi:OmpA family protein [Bdellovibrio svalbardensis]|uniref:OmpA family protein n=1 Tax=Bdellovibrio svalbardensis TaxID=2972972 RepID=A0ABT6DG77_9BACT|nr:OmpA family protein [Bdellovibrio svalbardensis]MDG0815845.1 OmpA family protein [Bdellovibrio svalbardensis]
MKKMIVMVSAIALLLSACATMEENKKTTAGIGIGALAGGIAGAVIGHQTGNRDAGALIGATLGAGVGGLIGNRLDKQQKELEKIAETKRTEQGLVTKLKSDILFDTGKADLKPQAKENINQLAAIMKKYPENVLTIKGYTDSTGSDKVNKPLSAKRANAVREQLVAAGIPQATVSSIGMGSENQVDAGKTKDALAKNRRVEIEITVDESKVPKQKGA